MRPKRAIFLCLIAAMLLLAVVPTASAAIRKLRVLDATSVTEKAAAMKFKVKLSRPAARRVRVAYNTVNGTATAGQDYIAKSGTLIFRRGQSAKTVSVSLRNDVIEEGVETIKLRIKDARRARIADNLGVGKIVGDTDAGPGEIVINEVMSVPNDDATGEWLELASLDTGPVDLTGWVLDESNLCTLSGTIPAGGYFVIGRNQEAQPFADKICTIVLVDSGELIRIWDGNPLGPTATVRDAVSSGEWDVFVPNKSFNLDPDAKTTTGNDSPTAWCIATSNYGAFYGTPGMANTECSPGG